MPSWLNMPLDGLLGHMAGPAMTIVGYLDPGMGSYALQMILATLFGGMFAIRQSWAEIKLWLSRRFTRLEKSTGLVSPGASSVEPRQAIPKQRIHGHSPLEIR